MPILQNPRHERFAQERAQGKSASEAFTLAGYSKSTSNAARLNANESVAQRITELMALAVHETVVTIESLQREADEIIRLAVASGQLGAANGALKLKAVFAGLYVEKADNINRNTTDPHALPDNTLADIAQRDAPKPEPAPVLPMLDTSPADDERDRLN
jgi:phage terminase small subunit